MANKKGELRRRLKRLGRSRVSTKPAAAVTAPVAVGLPPGEEVNTPGGTAYRIESRFPLAHSHGASRLEALLAFDAGLTAEVAGRPDLADLSFPEIAFLDTETTGLAGGAGTLVFLVGIGTFRQGEFRLRQYFLRDPVEEAGMLQALNADLDPLKGFVTFNGRAFDVPLLEARFVIGLRQRFRLTDWPHLDLLYPARRLWRRQLPDCRLNTLERRVLQVRRTEQDVPGEEIPGMYLRYLQTGDATEMSRIVYHNALDVLSLVGLTVSILSRHQQEELLSLSGTEALAMARWHHDAGRLEPAEAAYRLAESEAQGGVRIEALRHFAAYLKREQRHEEAIGRWKLWSSLAPDDPRPRLELAKAYEWRLKDLELAERWAQAGMDCLEHWPAGWRREQVAGEIQHRLNRLSRKLQRSQQTQR